LKRSIELKVKERRRRRGGKKKEEQKKEGTKGENTLLLFLLTHTFIHLEYKLFKKKKKNQTSISRFSLLNDQI